MTTQVSTPAASRISQIAVNGGKDFLLVTKEKPGRYQVVNYSGKAPHHDDFGFVVADCAASVVNLDHSSDAYDCFGNSNQVQVGGCIFGIETLEGPNLTELRNAAKGLVVASFDPSDI